SIITGPGLAPRRLLERDDELPRLALALHVERQPVADLRSVDAGLRILDIVRDPAVHAPDAVQWFQARTLGGAAAVHGGDHESSRAVPAEAAREQVAHRL